MQKIQKKIEIVRSKKARLSSMSRQSAEAILRVLSDTYSDVRITIVVDQSDLDALAVRKPDIVFLGVKYILDDAITDLEDSSKIWVSEFLESHHITHTGSNYLSHQLEADKGAAKRRVLAAGLSTSQFHVIKAGTSDYWHELTFPLFVKPTNRGGGQGIDTYSVVDNYKQLAAKVQWLDRTYGADALLENYLPGREFSVAIMQNNESRLLSAMPIELTTASDARGVSMLSEHVKSSNSETVQAVSDIPLKQRVIELALGVFTALGARDYGRIDIRLDNQGKAHFLEANFIPSLIDEYGSFPKAHALDNNSGYEAMILSITQSAMLRQS